MFGEKPIRLLVCGSRNWTDEGIIAEYIGKLVEGSVVIHGDCRGADRIAGRIAEELGFKVEKYPADWDTFGYQAGPIRNREMMSEGEPDGVLAFSKDISTSKGTADMLSVAEAAGVVWILVGEEG